MRVTIKRDPTSGEIRTRFAWSALRRSAPASQVATVGELAESWHAERIRRGQPTRDTSSFARAWILDPHRGLGDLPLADLSAEDVAAWLAYQRQAGLAPKTRAKHHALLSALLSHGVRIGAVTRNVARDLPAEDRPGRGEDEGADRAGLELLTLAELGRALAAASGRASTALRWYLATLYAFGLRPAEGAGLVWGDLVSRGGRASLLVSRQWCTKDLALRPTKSRRPRTLPAPGWWAALLDAAREAFALHACRAPQAADPLCWFPVRGHVPGRWNARTALRAWHGALRLAGIASPPTGPRRLHSLRHAYVDALIAAGADVALVSELTHPTSRTHRRHAFGRYVHEVWARRCDAVDRLPAPPDVARIFERAQLDLFGGAL